MKGLKGKYIMVLIAMCGVIGAVLGLVTNVAGLFFEPVAAEFGRGKGEVSMTEVFYAASPLLQWWVRCFFLLHIVCNNVHITHICDII